MTVTDATGAAGAMTTAMRVLNWSAAPQGLPPQGPLWQTAELARPPQEVRTALAETARATAARLGAGAPPLGERAPVVGLGALLLAAAVGGRRQGPVARRLAEAARRDYPSRRDPQSARWYDAFARHAVVAPAVLELAAEREAHIPLRTSTRPAAGAVTPVGEEHPEPEPLAEVLLGLSPLTAVLHRPPLRRLKGEATAAERGTAAALLAHPRGRELLISGLCRWTADPDTLLWRGELLTVLDAEDRELMLDVYAAARLRHGADWDARIHRAGRMLAARGPADRLALATVRLWVPLARKARYGVALGPARPLMKGYEPVLSLIRTYDLTRAGA